MGNNRVLYKITCKICPVSFYDSKICSRFLYVHISIEIKCKKCGKTPQNYHFMLLFYEQSVIAAILGALMLHIHPSSIHNSIIAKFVEEIKSKYGMSLSVTTLEAHEVGHWAKVF